MKLIIRQYLASLRERGELDAVVPDLLSQLGLTVFSRPARGTRQDGVDVGAVGNLEGDEKVYLFSIKPGDLTRRDWDGDALQSLRPSLNEILDAYIPNRMPAEHRNKPIVVCICLGGDVHEQVRPQLSGFIERHTTDSVSFQEWNGDKLAALIQSSFLREDLLPKDARSRLRKSLALLDEPTISYRHFSGLIKSLLVTGDSNPEKLTAIRQMSICLWILFTWCRDAGNTEAAYLSAEFTLLHAWTIVREYAEQGTKFAESIRSAFLSIYKAYQEVCGDFLSTDVLPHVDKTHALSAAIRASCSLDVNLKMFDLLGRIGLEGLWAYWGAMRATEDQAELKGELLHQVLEYSTSAKMMISNNPALLLPMKDDQAIDIFIALALLALDEGNVPDIVWWLNEIVERASFSYQTHGNYPCTLKAYGDLLMHPKQGDEQYRIEVTRGSILYPLISVWVTLYSSQDIYEGVARLKRESLGHCNFQIWYPDEISEAHIYTNSDSHGATLSDICLDFSGGQFLAHVFSECEKAPSFKELSAVKYGWWPLVIIACRHYRLPLPLHLIEGLYERSKSNSAESGQEKV